MVLRAFLYCTTKYLYRGVLVFIPVQLHQVPGNNLKVYCVVNVFANIIEQFCVEKGERNNNHNHTWLSYYFSLIESFSFAMPTMHQSLEPTPRDVAGGYLLLMLSKGDVKETPSKESAKASSQLQQQAIERLKQKERELPEKIRQREQIELYLELNAGACPSIKYQSFLDFPRSKDPPAVAIPNTEPATVLNSPSPLIHQVTPDELHEDEEREDGDQVVKAALGDVAANLRPFATSMNEGTTREQVRVCSPSPPSPPGSPKYSSGSSVEDEISSFPPLLVPTSNKIRLPQWFKDSKTTVVIGKGHLPRTTPGNLLLRQMVRERLEDYKQRNRRGRADIVSEIYSTIQRRNPDGRYFGNFTPRGEWCEAKEHSARDKIAATFRDCLSHLYKSSTKSKVAKRRKQKVEQTKKVRNKNWQ